MAAKTTAGNSPSPQEHRGPNGSAEPLECTVPVDYRWAWPTRALSFAPVTPGTMLSSRLDDVRWHTRCVENTVDMRHASDTQDVAFDVRHDGHADGAIGIELQLA